MSALRHYAAAGMERVRSAWVRQATRPVARPPDAPAGWVSMAPDYVGVGTARSGTTWWDDLIQGHPDVARAPGVPKELHYFDRFWSGESSDPDAAAYHAFFPRPLGKRAGEWTPGYMLQFWTPPMLQRAAPDARLLVLLRDPVERLRSAMTLTENRLTFTWNARSGATGGFHRGVYADQLLRLWNVFPRGQVLVLQYERCVQDPVGQLRRTFAFIGLNPDPADRLAVEKRVNGTRGSKVRLRDNQRRLIIERYEPENQRLAALVPDLDLGLWTRP